MPRPWEAGCAARVAASLGLDAQGLVDARQQCVGLLLGVTQEHEGVGLGVGGEGKKED